MLYIYISYYNSVHKILRFQRTCLFRDLRPAGLGYGVTENSTEVPLPRANIGRPFFLGPAPGGVRLVFFNLAYVLMCLLHAIVVVNGISITLVRMHRIRGTMYLYSGNLGLDHGCRYWSAYSYKRKVPAAQW